MTTPTFQTTTLYQPYATLIAVRAKRFETRSYPAPRGYLGKRIAIHAGKRQPSIKEVRAAPQSIIDALGGRGWAHRIPYSAVVCTARLAGCWQVRAYEDGEIHFDGRVSAMDDGFGDYRPGRWCWELDQIEQIVPPAPASGQQSWWTWPRAAS